MFSDYQLFGTARRSLSNNKYKLAYSHPKKQTQKSLLFVHLLKNIIHLKICNHFDTFKQQATQRKNKKEKINSISKIMKRLALRNGFGCMQLNNCRKMKVRCGVQLLTFSLRRMKHQRKEHFILQLKKQYCDKSTDRFYVMSAQALFRLMTRKMEERKRTSLIKMKEWGKEKERKVRNIEKIMNHILTKKKIQSFYKIYSHHLYHKPSNTEIENPTVESQENLHIIEGLEEQEKANRYQLLKKSTSDKNFHNFHRLKDSLDEKRKRSLSKKSRVSSLLDEEIGVILGSFSKQDFKSVKNGEQKKNKHYKNLAQTYKKQLEIIKVELQVMKELNESYENQIDSLSEFDEKEVKMMRMKVAMLQKEKQKYKQKSISHQKQMNEMKEEFKHRLESLQLKIKRSY